MLYTRELASNDINTLGPDWQDKLDRVVNATIAAATAANNPTTANARVLAVMNKTPMTVSGIVAAHNIINGRGSMSLNYGRFVIAGLLKARLIERVAHGVYCKQEA